MSLSSDHPSCLQLDLYFISRATPPGDRETTRAEREVEQHLRQCEPCAQYLQQLHAVQAGVSVPSEVPKALAAVRPIAKGRVRRSRKPLYSAFGACLAAAAAWWFVAQPTTPPYVGVKGEPMAQVLLQRGGQLQPWTATQLLRPQDVLALRVACGPFAHLQLLSPGVPNQPSTALAALPCPSASQQPLPFTLRVDSQPGPERFTLVWSVHPLHPDEVQRALDTPTQSPQIWVTHFALPKEIP